MFYIYNETFILKYWKKLSNVRMKKQILSVYGYFLALYFLTFVLSIQ